VSNSETILRLIFNGLEIDFKDISEVDNENKLNFNKIYKKLSFEGFLQFPILYNFDIHEEDDDEEEEEEEDILKENDEEEKDILKENDEEEDIKENEEEEEEKKKYKIIIKDNTKLNEYIKEFKENEIIKELINEKVNFNKKYEWYLFYLYDRIFIFTEYYKILKDEYYNISNFGGKK
jgi:hypothetical protein